jgi:ribosomal protein L40E
MKCSSCQSENPDGAKFCIECGSSFEHRCQQCGPTTPAGAKFCMECGYKLKGSGQKPTIDYSPPQSCTPNFLADKILTTRRIIEGERKLVTVLFADVANSIELSHGRETCAGWRTAHQSSKIPPPGFATTRGL